MKTTRVFVFVLLLSSFDLSAQEKNLREIYMDVTTAINSALLTRSGSMEISGFLSYHYFSMDYTNDEKGSQQIIQIEPVFSYFIVKNISLGIELSYLRQKTDYASSGGAATIEQTFIGPVAKIYFGKDKFRPFIITDYLFLAGDDYDGGVLDFGAGIFYHVTGNFGFSLFGKYGIIWSAKDNIDRQNRLFFGIGISNFIL